ncbi:MAG: TetR/AcrR family transcriptional regulator [Caulobacterales bacterium]|jgi:AcrR family transcriptional regulator
MSRQDFLQRRAAAKRVAVLAAARDRFATDGFERANMERIAHDAQVSTATLYRQFPSKIDLFQAVLAQSVVAFETELAAAAERTPRQRIEALAHAYAHTLDDPFNAGILRAVFSAAPTSPEVATAFYEHVKRVVAGAFHEAMAAAATARLIVAADDPGQPGGHLMGMVEHAILWRRLLQNTPGPQPPDEIAAAALLRFWRAYGV